MMKNLKMLKADCLKLCPGLFIFLSAMRRNRVPGVAGGLIFGRTYPQIKIDGE